MSAVLTPSQDDPFAALNPEQRAAVEHDIGVATPRPLLVVAGAGSGKTNTLAHRVARLIQAGARHHQQRTRRRDADFMNDGRPHLGVESGTKIV